MIAAGSAGRRAATAAYALVSGLSFFLLLQICQRCGQDNAYLLEFFLGVLLVAIGLVLGAMWLFSGRAGPDGFAVGALVAVAVAVINLGVGSTRTLIPPVLTVLEIAMLVLGLVAVRRLRPRDA